MGRVFVPNQGGTGLLYACKGCETYLTAHGQLSSPNFNGSTGPAMLFKKVWNIEQGKMERRKMTTGWHVVRDVLCIVCKARVGWMYELAYDDEQAYKEGQVILENRLIVRMHGLEDPLGATQINIDHLVPVPHFLRLHHSKPNALISSRLAESASASPSEAGSVSDSSDNSLSSILTRR